MWLITSALAGYDTAHLSRIERVLRTVVGLTLLVPQPMLAGVALIAAVILIARHRLARKSPVSKFH